MGYSRFEDMKDILKAMGLRSKVCESCGLYGEPTECPKCGKMVCSTCISVQKDMCMNCDEVVGLKIGE